MEQVLTFSAPGISVKEIEVGFERYGPFLFRYRINNQEYGGTQYLSQKFAYNFRAPDLFFEQMPTRGFSVLELGSFEGEHTFRLMERAGLVVGLEGRETNLAKCQFLREVLQADKVRFHLENLETCDLSAYGSFDTVFCAGVLYHLPNPGRLLHQIATVTDRLFLDTHYSISNGFIYKEYGLDDPLSGLSPESLWLTREELVRTCRSAGFNNISCLMDQPKRAHGPGIVLWCRRT